MVDTDCWDVVSTCFSTLDFTKRPKAIRGDAFGELKLVLFGDFKQLPPATSKPPFIVQDTV